MNRIVDIHNHLNTLNGLIRLRGMLQGHLTNLEDYLRDDTQIIISVPLYVNFYRQYNDLIGLINSFKKRISEASQDIVLITEKSDLSQNFRLGIVLHVESARTIENLNDNLSELYDCGIRGIIPVHFIDNQFGNSCDDPLRRLGLKQKDKGLTAAGEIFVEKCNDLGLWLDLTHTTDQTATDILQIAKTVMVSHIGVRDLRPIQRNKPLSLLKEVAKGQGLIGLSPWKHLMGRAPLGLKEHYQFLVENGLENAIAIGSDFGVPIGTDSQYHSLFSIADIIKENKFLSENAMGFLKGSLP